MVETQVVDGRRQPFFLVDNAVVLEKAATIGSHALALYVILACHARADSGACYPSIRRLMQLMGRSRPVVFAALRALEDQKLISVEQRRSDHGGLKSNLYTLLLVPGALPAMGCAEVEGLFAVGVAVAAVTGCGLMSPDGPCAADAPDDREDGDTAAAIAEDLAYLPIERGVVNNADEGSQRIVPGVVNIVDEGGKDRCLPLVNIVYSEQDSVLNKTNGNKTDSNKTNLKVCAPAARRARTAPMARLVDTEVATFFAENDSTRAEVGRRCTTGVHRRNAIGRGGEETGVPQRATALASTGCPWWSLPSGMRRGWRRCGLGGAGSGSGCGPINDPALGRFAPSVRRTRCRRRCNSACWVGAGSGADKRPCIPRGHPSLRDEGPGDAMQMLVRVCVLGRS